MSAIIGLGNLAANTTTARTWSLDDVFYSIAMDENAIWKDPVDGLALSCLHFKNRMGTTTSMNTTEDDHELARKIRDYYGKKLVIKTLKEQKLTKFRKDLAVYLKEGYTTEYPEKFKGMIYRLPEFYYYDQEIDELREDSSNNVVESFIGVKTLTLVKKLSRATTAGTSIYFWFHDENKNLYSIRTDKNNVLISLLESICSNGSIKLSGHFKYSTKDDLHYCIITNPKLLF